MQPKQTPTELIRGGTSAVDKIKQIPLSGSTVERGRVDASAD